MEEPICHIEISKEDEFVIAKLQSEWGGIREFKSLTFEGTLKMLVNELQAELEQSQNSSMME